MTPYPLLFTPLTLNKLELKNRVVLPAMHLNYTPDGKVSEQLIKFYAERAAGDAGLIIVGGCAISPMAGMPMMISLKDDSDIAGLKELTQAAHAHGAAMGAQLYHAGAYAHQAFIGSQALSSSEHTSAFTREEARALSKEEIPAVQDEFAAAAVRAKKAGFDMVEILGSAGYLISQFLSPKINKREDEYGGSLENCMRFGLEVVQKVRAAVGDDYCVGIRLAGNDFVPGGNTNPQSAAFAQKCEQAGVDVIDVTGGWHETRVPQLTPEVPPAGLTYLSRGIKRQVSVPVCASNRIHTPDMAEAVLARGDADLICVARPFIAEPNWAGKAKAGMSELIRPCISCNQGCFDAVMVLKPIGCLCNPRAGHEAKMGPELPQAQSPGTVVVAGGGAAGCEAALTAARRGHQVILMEADAALGGQPRWYAAPTQRPEFARLGGYHTAALSQAGVEVRLNTKATAQDIADLNPQAVVLATGALPAPPPFEVADDATVLQAWQVLQGKALAQGRTVVVGGGAVGLETALMVARQGALTPEQVYFLTLFRAEQPEVIDDLIASGSQDVTVLEVLPKVGQEIGRSTRWVVLGRLKRFGLKVRTKAKVSSIGTQGVQAVIDGTEELLPADTVILSTGMTPQDGLAAELKSLGISPVVIGDAAKAGSLLKAVAQGRKAGLDV